MTLEAAHVGDGERSAALDGWVAAFEREMEQSGNFAMSVAAMTAHGCFDVRAVVERWMLANPSGDLNRRQAQPVLQEPVPLRLVPDGASAPEQPPALDAAPGPEAAPALAEAGAPQDPVVDPERTSRRPESPSSPDIAYFRSLLQGGIERAQIDEAFPGFRLVIDEAVAHHEAAEGPILSDIPAPPSREDLNDEIRGMREKLQESAKRGRRRWRARN